MVPEVGQNTEGIKGTCFFTNYATNMPQQNNSLCSLDTPALVKNMLLNFVLRIDDLSRILHYIRYFTNKTSVIFSVQMAIITLGVQPTQLLTTLWSCNSQSGQTSEDHTSTPRGHRHVFQMMLCTSILLSNCRGIGSALSH